MITASSHIEDFDFDLTRCIDELQELLESSTYEQRARHWLSIGINNISTREEYDKTKQNLLLNQIGIDSAVNPSQKEINAHLRKFTKVPS